MRKITFSIPRLNDEKSIIEENARLFDAFFNQCEDSPEKIVESDIQSFFDAYVKLEKLQRELISSQWAHCRELGGIVEDLLKTVKNRFDELGISVKCRFDFDHTEIFNTFEQIRTVF